MISLCNSLCKGKKKFFAVLEGSCPIFRAFWGIAKTIGSIGSFELTSSPPRLSVDENHSASAAENSRLLDVPRYHCEGTESPYQTGQLHPAIRVADLLQHINLMKTSDSYGSKPQILLLDVSGSVFDPRYCGPVRWAAGQYLRRQGTHLAERLFFRDRRVSRVSYQTEASWRNNRSTSGGLKFLLWKT